MLLRAKRERRRPRPVAEINITPFTDVILVLLIIFMITTPLMSQATLKVKLPEAQTAKPDQGSTIARAYVTITNEGVIYLDDKVVTRKELKEKITVVHQKNPDIGVLLRADRAVRFKDVVEVLDILNGLNISRLDIETLTTSTRQTK